MNVLKFIAVALAAISMACTPATAPSSTNSPAYIAAQLEGTWNLASIQPAGSAKQATPATAVYTLTFNSNGRLSTRADCNTCAGTFSVEGTNVMTAANLACTRAACPTMTFESAYTTLLGGSNEAAITTSSLTLSSPRGTMWLSRKD